MGNSGFIINTLQSIKDVCHSCYCPVSVCLLQIFGHCMLIFIQLFHHVIIHRLRFLQRIFLIVKRHKAYKVQHHLQKIQTYKLHKDTSGNVVLSTNSIRLVTTFTVNFCSSWNRSKSKWKLRIVWPSYISQCNSTGVFLKSVSWWKDSTLLQGIANLYCA